MWNWLRRLLRPTPTPIPLREVRRPDYRIQTVSPPVRHHTVAAVPSSPKREFQPRHEAPSTDFLMDPLNVLSPLHAAGATFHTEGLAPTPDPAPACAEAPSTSVDTYSSSTCDPGPSFDPGGGGDSGGGGASGSFD